HPPRAPPPLSTLGPPQCPRSPKGFSSPHPLCPITAPPTPPEPPHRPWDPQCPPLSRVSPQVRPRVVREQVLWVSGQGRGGVHTFRVPLVAATPGGALLACAEGRKRSAADVGAKIIACRHSPDGGATWGPTEVAADDGWEGDGLNLGALAVVGPEVLLLFARCAHPPQACGPPSTLLLRSRDGGRSWGPPQNLSDVVGGEVFAPGPGSGIQKQRAPFRGRLVFCGHGTLERDGVTLLLSDDGGRRWRRGGGPARHPLRGPPAPPRLHPRRVPALRAARRLHRREHPQPGLVPLPLPDAGAELGRGRDPSPRRRHLPARAAGPGRGRRGPGQPRARALQQPSPRERAGEPDAALELRQRHHVVGAGPARVGGAQRVLGAGGAAPRGAGPRPPGVPHLREGAEPLHRERLIGHHQPGGRPLTPPRGARNKAIGSERRRVIPGGVAGRWREPSP
uniref:Sialidase-1 n=1 Tax=Corvus moneduloides TaxID=1196302 RepID=A0A8U7NH12_CORMO